MKRILVLMVLVVLYATAMQAQWSDDPSVNLQLSDQKGATPGSIKVAKTTDGKMFVSWTTYEGKGGQTRLQLLDKNGNLLWDKGGILVSEHPAASYTTDFDMKTSSDGCAIIAYSDSRTDLETLLDFKPYVYKIDQEGNYLWGIDGVAIPCKSHQGMRPRIGLTNAGSIIIGYSDAINGLFCMQKINEDGELEWAQNLEFGGIMGNFIATGEDDFILTWFGGGLRAQRFDTYGEAIWEKEVVIEDGLTLNGHVEPQMLSDGEGGFAICYARAIGISEHYVCIQRVSADGETMMGMQSVVTGDGSALHSCGHIGIDTQNKTIVCQWNKQRGDDQRHFVNKYDYFGDPQWGKEGIELDLNWMFGFYTYGTVITDDQGCILIYSDYQDSAVKDKIMAKKLDQNGQVQWTQELCSNLDYKLRGVTCVHEDQICVFWSSETNTEVYGQNISLDGKLGVLASGIENSVLSQNDEIYYSEGSLHIFGKAVSEGLAKLKIADISGAVIHESMISISNATTSVPLSLLQGVYVIHISFDDQEIVSKIVVR